MRCGGIAGIHPYAGDEYNQAVMGVTRSILYGDRVLGETVAFLIPALTRDYFFD